MSLSDPQYSGVDKRKLALLGAGSSLTVAALSYLVFGVILGRAILEFDAVLSAAVFYVVYSAPRRAFQARRISQSRESVSLSVVASVTMGVTCSRAKTFMTLRARERELDLTLKEIRRRILLGASPEIAVASSVAGLSSYSAAGVLRSTALTRPSSPTEGGEEARGLESSSQLSDETKLPVFMTACLFSPILLLVYSVLAHLNGAVPLVELVALQFVVLDLAFYACSTERRAA